MFSGLTIELSPWIRDHKASPIPGTAKLFAAAEESRFDRVRVLQGESTNDPQPPDGMMPWYLQGLPYWTRCGKRTYPQGKDWHAGQSKVRPVQSSRLLNRSDRELRFCGFTHLIDRIRQHRTKVPLVVVQNLAVERLLSTPFINHHVKRTLLGLQKALFHHFSVTVIGQRSFSNPKICLPLELENKSRKVRTSRRTAIPPLLLMKR